MNLQLRHYLIDSGRIKLYKQRRKHGIFYDNYMKYEDTERAKKEWEEYSELNTFLEETGSYEESIEACKFINSITAKRKRVRKKIKRMSEYKNTHPDVYLSFVTFTFTDYELSNTSEETRRRKLREYLNKYALDYVLNVDYGDETGREHYHAVVLYREKLKKKDQCWSGYTHIKPIHASVEDIRKTAQYLTKLSSHACKSTTKFKSIISKRKPLCYLN